MSRFFTDNIQGDRAVISGEDVRHIRKVLRLSSGDMVTICDGNNTEYDAEISEMSETEVVLTLSNKRESEAESIIRLTLFQGIPKSGKMETIVQKCTEIGASDFVPVLFERCVSIPQKDYGKKLVRYNRVALEAAKQSRRGRIPNVQMYIKPDAIPVDHFDLCILAYEEERERKLKDALQDFSGSTVGLIIGPEGGISKEEAEMLKKKGAVSVSLGSRILRTETAGMSAASNILFELD